MRPTPYACRMIAALMFGLGIGRVWRSLPLEPAVFITLAVAIGIGYLSMARRAAAQEGEDAS